MAEKADPEVKPLIETPSVVKPLIEPDAEQEGEEGDQVAEEVESTAQFEPVVHLEEVEVKTLEEEEEVLYKVRAKLFVFGETLLNKGSGQKTWNERGIGEFKFLKHKIEKKIRILMRQEKTMKIIANHIADPRIVLMPNAGSDRSWVWTAFDFVDGELSETVFAIRFGNTDQANAFKEKFEEIKEEMKVLLESEWAKEAGTDQTTDEATKAFESLSIEKNETEAEKKES